MKFTLLFVFCALVTQAQTSFLKSYYFPNAGFVLPPLEGFTSVCEVEDGNLLLVGTDHTQAMGQRAVAVKLNPAGDVIWKRTYASAPYNRFKRASLLSDGNYVVVGENTNQGSTSSKPFVVKIDPEGTPVWTRNLTDYGTANDVLALSNGSFVMCGSAGMIARFVNDGTQMWQRRVFDTTEYTGFNALVRATDGTFIAVGRKNGQMLGGYLLQKVSMSGHVLWDKSGYFTDEIFLKAAVIHDNDGIVAVGHKDEANVTSVIMAVFTPDGNLARYRTYVPAGTGAVGSDIVKTDDGFIICGSTNGGGILFKTDKAGNVLWSKAVTTVDQQEMCLSQNGLLLLGFSQMFGSFNMLYRLNTSGFPEGCTEPVVVESNPGMFSIVPQASVLDSVGIFSEPYSSISTPLDSLVTETDCISVGVSAVNAFSSLSLYPNPAASEINVRLPDPINGILLTYNSLGQLVSRTVVAGNELAVDVSSWPRGYYRLVAAGRDRTFTASFVKE